MMLHLCCSKSWAIFNFFFLSNCAFFLVIQMNEVDVFLSEHGLKGTNKSYIYIN